MMEFEMSIEVERGGDTNGVHEKCLNHRDTGAQRRRISLKNPFNGVALINRLAAYVEIVLTEFLLCASVPLSLSG
jgi:hypothetical protein